MLVQTLQLSQQLVQYWSVLFVVLSPVANRQAAWSEYKAWGPEAAEVVVGGCLRNACYCELMACSPSRAGAASDPRGTGGGISP